MAKGRGWMYLYRKHLFSERAETVISLRVDSKSGESLPGEVFGTTGKATFR